MAVKEGITILRDKREVSRDAREIRLRAAKEARSVEVERDLSRVVRSPHNSFDYVYSKIQIRRALASISGGSDILSCLCSAIRFCGLPGEIQTPGLGMAEDVFDDRGGGQVIPASSVCTSVSNHADRFSGKSGWGHTRRLFRYFPGVWRHGDWAEITKHRGSSLRRSEISSGGVRIGTAEIYRQVEQS